MLIRWTAPAAADLYSISRYIRRNNPEAALEIVRTIYDACETLVQSPSRGRKGKQPGTRELVLAPLPYIIAYRIRESVIEILHIWHGARNR